MAKSGVTLLELTVVVVIIGILSSLGIYNYSTMKERELDREAKLNLSLIRAAERIRFMETNAYMELIGIASINDNLKLAIPLASPSWDYRVKLTGSGTGFNAMAKRAGGDERVWCLTQSESLPPQINTCQW